jgi:hypothetical protein
MDKGMLVLVLPLFVFVLVLLLWKETERDKGSERQKGARDKGYTSSTIDVRSTKMQNVIALDKKAGTPTRRTSAITFMRTMMGTRKRRREVGHMYSMV